MLLSGPDFDKLIPAFCKKTMEPPNKKSLFPDDRCVNVVISLIKIPPVPLLIRFNLPRPLYDSSIIDSICVFIRDSERTYRDREYGYLAEEFIRAFKPVTAKYGFKFKIITAKQLLTEYRTFQDKRKLACRFNLFLVDSRVSATLVCRKAFGKEFRRRGKWPIPFKISKYMRKNNVLDKFEKRILHRSVCELKGTGNTVSVRVGNASSQQTIRENCESVYDQICSMIPGGGFENVRSVHLVCNTTQHALPLFSKTENAKISFDPIQIEKPPCTRFNEVRGDCVVTGGDDDPNDHDEIEFKQPNKFVVKRNGKTVKNKRRTFEKWTMLKIVKIAKRKARAGQEIDSD